MEDGKPKILTEEDAKLFANIDYSSQEMRIVAQMRRDQIMTALIADGKSPTGRMTQVQPVRYLGLTYSSRERKD